ncbi:MAG: LysR family transcriptional regulator [Candidatus Limnocylindrales bacterium]
MSGTALEHRATVHQLRIFKTVADLGSFTRAAEALHLSQPAISHQVKALAAVAGGPLFETIDRRSQVTEVGRLLYEHAGRILAEFEAVDRAIEALR